MSILGKKAKILLWVCGILFLIFVGGLGAIFFSNAVFDQPRYKSRVCPVMLLPIVPDTVAKADTLASHARAYDSIMSRMAMIDYNHMMLQKQHDKAVDDMRQETNNYINKINGWLSLWIAASAILTILMPIVIQYLNNRVERKYMFERMRILKNKLLEIEGKIREIHEDYEQQKYLQETLHLVHIGIENSLMTPEDYKTGSVISHFWRNLHSHFVKRVRQELKSGTISSANILKLQETLLYISDYVRELQRIVPRYQSRRFLEINDSISALYRRLEKRENLNQEQLRAAFKSILEQFNSLII